MQGIADCLFAWGAIEAAGREGSAAIGHINDQRAVSSGGIHRAEQHEITRVAHAAVGAAGSMLEVDNSRAITALRIDGVVQARANQLVRPPSRRISPRSGRARVRGLRCVQRTWLALPWVSLEGRGFRCSSPQHTLSVLRNPLSLSPLPTQRQAAAPPAGGRIARRCSSVAPCCACGGCTTAGGCSPAWSSP